MKQIKAEEGKNTENVNEIANLMDSKMNQLDSLLGMLDKKSTGSVANVKEILADSIQEQVSEVAKDVIGTTVTKAIEKVTEDKGTKDK